MAAGTLRASRVEMGAHGRKQLPTTRTPAELHLVPSGHRPAAGRFEQRRATAAGEDPILQYCTSHGRLAGEGGPVGLQSS